MIYDLLTIVAVFVCAGATVTSLLTVQTLHRTIRTQQEIIDNITRRLHTLENRWMSSYTEPQGEPDDH